MIHLYGLEKIYQEAAFIGYYFHWGRNEIFSLSHLERIKWCNQISDINKKLNDEPENVFDINP